jgi:hypothetical protein
MVALQSVLFADACLVGADVTERVCRHMVLPEERERLLRGALNEDELLISAGERFYPSLRETAVELAAKLDRGVLICGDNAIYYIAADQWLDPSDFHIDEILETYNPTSEALLFMEYPERVELICLRADGERSALGEWSLTNDLATAQAAPELLARHG